MRTYISVAAALAATLVAVLLAGAGSASAGVAAVVRPCTINEVSFYFGGYFYGLGQRSFDLTLADSSGVTCTLTDTPLVSLGGPPDQTKPIPVHVDGRGGTLTLRPDSPLHATLSYNAPDTPEDTIEVSTLTLAMPDKSSRATDFLFPGTTEIYSGGVSVTSWRTGLGRGQGE